MGPGKEGGSGVRAPGRGGLLSGCTMLFVYHDLAKQDAGAKLWHDSNACKGCPKVSILDCVGDIAVCYHGCADPNCVVGVIGVICE